MPNACMSIDGVFFLIFCVYRICGESIEAALPAAVGEQGEGAPVPGGGCASIHLPSAKVAFHLSAIFPLFTFHGGGSQIILFADI